MGNSFKLQPVLKHRGLLEDQARQRLATALNAELALRDRVEAEREALATLQAELRRQQLQGLSVQDLLLYESHIDHRGRVLRHLSQECALVEQEVASCRLALCKTSQDRQLLEKLKTKHETEERQRQLQRETRMLDEIALQFRGVS